MRAGRRWNLGRAVRPVAAGHVPVSPQARVHGTECGPGSGCRRAGEGREHQETRAQLLHPARRDRQVGAEIELALDTQGSPRVSVPTGAPGDWQRVSDGYSGVLLKPCGGQGKGARSQNLLQKEG